MAAREEDDERAGEHQAAGLVEPAGDLTAIERFEETSPLISITRAFLNVNIDSEIFFSSERLRSTSVA